MLYFVGTYGLVMARVFAQEGPLVRGEIEYDELVLATGSSPFVPNVSGNLR